MPLMDYNEALLQKSITSIMSQSYGNFEVVIKYNGSDLSAPSRSLKNFSNDSRIIFHACPDSSVAEAANQAMRLCTGDLITLFAHDDIYCDGAFQALIDHADGSLWYFGKINYYTEKGLRPTYYYPTVTLRDMEKENYIPQPACFWSRDAYDAIGGYDESFKLCWDYDYWIRLFKHAPPKYIDFAFADYFLNKNSISLKCSHLMEGEKQLIKEKHYHV